MKGTLAEHLLDNSELVTETGCRIWLLGLHGRSSYGQLRYKGKTCYAHRLAYEVFVKEIPANRHVLHICDVPCCINPAHLYIGTPADNAKDRVRRGRNNHHIGAIKKNGKTI